MTRIASVYCVCVPNKFVAFESREKRRCVGAFLAFIRPNSYGYELALIASLRAEPTAIPNNPVIEVIDNHDHRDLRSPARLISSACRDLHRICVRLLFHFGLRRIATFVLAFEPSPIPVAVNPVNHSGNDCAPLRDSKVNPINDDPIFFLPSKLKMIVS